LGNLRVT